MGNTVDHPAPILNNQDHSPRPARVDARPNGPSVELVVDGDHAVQWLAGEIDIATCGHVLELGLLALTEPRVNALILDLSEVTFLDSAGLGTLVQLKNHSVTVDKRMALRAVPPSVSKLLTLTNLNRRFGLMNGDAGRC